jgi:hypothetical protein
MLASAVDREHAVEFLKTAYADGRLSKDEYDTRMGQALDARTYADLDALITDLPGARPPIPPAPPRTNGFAIAALACGIAQFVGFWLLGTIPAVVFGHIARRQIRQTGEQGAGLAMAGLVLGWVGVALSVLVAVGITLLVVGAAGTTPTGG